LPIAKDRDAVGDLLGRAFSALTISTMKRCPGVKLETRSDGTVDFAREHRERNVVKSLHAGKDRRHPIDLPQ
jgi:hypothetical protein